MNGVDLECASPRLFRCRHLELAVPGMHDAASGIVKVQLFQPHLAVIASKQRPRRLAIVGSDGLAYRFLLKGHEDLRQDQRVMQFFGLVNTLLETSSETTKRHLSIRTFSVIPLSQNTGLISWLPHCDTMHALVKDFRESRGMLLSLEHRLMLQFAPDYDRLALLQKVEAFKHAMDKTEGDDLAKVFWQKSKSSEVWFERRVSYVRTLAVMSISGYILGLGDRHPSNLLIDRVTGQVVHIDFGDCFEVAMQRERFPEKVPFRLTRMLVNALEVPFLGTCMQGKRGRGLLPHHLQMHVAGAAIKQGQPHGLAGGVCVRPPHQLAAAHTACRAAAQISRCCQLFET